MRHDTPDVTKSTQTPPERLVQGIVKRTAMEVIASCSREGWEHLHFGATVMRSRDGKMLKVVLPDGRTVTGEIESA